MLFLHLHGFLAKSKIHFEINKSENHTEKLKKN